MLASRYRLSHTESKKLRRRFRRFNLTPFELRVAAVDASRPSRFGVVVAASAVNKSAVGKSRAARRIRHALANVITQLRPGYVCLLILKGPLGILRARRLESQLLELFAIVNLITYKRT